ncbi:predicted protein [Uncinocarpus reesii 1704]|uniref:Uncharacterized protein n=1 Tax=Uncinocarpus reesii (strain UAMH 1704) TaxID=336963 RepID=C4JRU8_UNCRE|nr:uncharacterized protein UREG_05187 [Uncinocarpus reesii 1704]EEP80345.1 predicted protein [Uncinocarpus reesii 1704]
MIPVRLWFHIGATTAVILFAIYFNRDSFLFSAKNREVAVSKIISETRLHFAVSDIPGRHQQEREQLYQRLHWQSGKPPTHHARHRLLSALHGFYRYEKTAMQELDTIRRRYSNVGKEQKLLVESVIGYEEKIRRTEQLIKKNDKIAQEIFDCALSFYQVEFLEFKQFTDEIESGGKSAERVSVSQALKHFVRDWAPEGGHERMNTFPQILESLQKHYPNRDSRDPVQVLVPGFEVTANEWSSFMNLAYRYLTSPKVALANSTTIHPYVDWWSHQPSNAELHRSITFPEVLVDPSSVLLVEGDFTTVFNQDSDSGRFDVIVTLFFIDTARNLLTYIETIHRLLKPGRTVRQKEAPYGFNARALSKNAYWAQFWIAVRQ